jgi:Spy/CpxP family protein refolding chaperone
MKTLHILFTTLFLTATAFAQPGRGPGMGQGSGLGMGPGAGAGPQLRMANWEDRADLFQHFFPPELVMRYADKIEVTKPQRDAILKAQNEAQAKLNTLHWDLRDAMDALETLIKADKVDAAKSKEALNKVIEIEKQLKTTQMTLMIDVKNQLNEKQIATLREVRAEQMDRVRDRRNGKGNRRIEKRVRIIDGQEVEDNDDDDDAPKPRKNN